MMGKKMTVIITMAGLGTRFRKAGYQLPKYMIEAKGKTLFEWSMDSLLDYNSYVKTYIFVVREEDHAASFIEEKFVSYDIQNIRIVELDHVTGGQAESCMLAIPYCSQEDAVIVYNIDTYVEANILKYADISGDGYAPCFQAFGDHWSFVKLDESGNAVEVREKKRISDNCTLGAYYFSSAALFQQLYEEFYKDYMENNEKYIAPLYNLMIEKGMSVRISIVDDKKVHVLGTPEELREFLNEGS